MSLCAVWFVVFVKQCSDVYQAFQVDVQKSIPTIRIPVSEFLYARQDVAHRTEIQRLLAIFKTIQIAANVESDVLRPLANHVV
jgi:hypothetical protein